MLSVSVAASSPIFDPGPYLQPQRLVDIGGRRLNIYCVGTGSPAVIFDAGLGGTTSSWRLVQSRVAKKTLTCSYDRAGMGFSDPPGAQRDAGTIVSDLHTLLHNAQIPGPYVLVGHSIAGLYDRLFADRYFDEMAGMVLVDPAPPDEDPSDDPVDAAAYRRCARAAEARQLVPDTQAFSDCGLLNDAQLRRKCDVEGQSQCKLDALDNDRQRSPVFWTTTGAEFFSAVTSSAQVLREQRSLGNMPLVVLTRGAVGFSPGSDTDKADIADYLYTKIEDRRIAALSTIGRDVIVPEVGHDIQIERPNVVIAAIDDVIDQARSRAR